jgi:hypothetical protein
MAKNTREYARSFSIHLDPRNLYEFEGFRFDFNSQRIMGVKNEEAFPLIGQTSLECNRDRKKGGKKVLHKSISPGGEARFNSNLQLLDYNHLIAVDTNTHQYQGASVSVTAAFHIIPEDVTSEQALCKCRVLALFEMWNVACKPENLGWWQVLQAIEKSPMGFEGTIGFIVDSDLGNHEKFNAKDEPIVGKYFLPENVRLIYGSDKGGHEHLSTKMIKYCHDLASDLYREESLLLNPNGLIKSLSELYSHARQWDTEARDLRSFI